jgi:hypothetical protein
MATLSLVQYFSKLKFNFTMKWFYLIITVLISVLVITVCFIDLYKTRLISGDLITDEFARGNLKADVTWSGFEFILGIIFLAGSLLIFYGINRKKLTLVYYGFATNLAFIYFSINILVPKIEQYTQHSAIEFYKACNTLDCYVETHSFKSYAYLFYSQRNPSHYVNADQQRSIKERLDYLETLGHSRFSSFANANGDWMKLGKIDKPAFIIAKTKDEKELEEYAGLKKLYDQNGFSFYVRMPVQPAK